MTRYALGDVQGCYDELRALVERIGFSADRDRLWFVGDLVNRGPKSLEVLRYVRALGDNAVVVLGNHDLHLLALAYGSKDKRKSGDTLDAILEASDREALLEWLLARPLTFLDSDHGDLMVHAGVVPQWSTQLAMQLAKEVEVALRDDPRKFLDAMYGNEPDCWSPGLAGMDRLRFVINVLTRMRICTAEGRIDAKFKGKPGEVKAPFRPWFEFEERASRDVRVVFGHWSALGYLNTGRVVGLDTGCVWGAALTALNLDAEAAPVIVACGG